MSTGHDCENICGGIGKSDKDKAERAEEEVRSREINRLAEEAECQREAQMAEMEQIEQLHRDEAQEREEKRRADEKKRIQEDREYRQRLSDRKDKLAGLIGFQERGDLPPYLDKFEYLMRTCEVDEEEWVDKLHPKLPERLCARVRTLVDDNEGYVELKGALLMAVGETVAEYGSRLFSITSETF